MIIGKSLTALGGGGLKPEITVTAKAGALLNLHYKDSSIILQSYQLGAEETQHTFVVDVSETAYVVEDATNGKSVEVFVDAVAQYRVEISYWNGELFYLGNEYSSITGGYDGGSSYEVSNDGTDLLFRRFGDSNEMCTVNLISFEGYTTLKVKVRWKAGASATTFAMRVKDDSGNILKNLVYDWIYSTGGEYSLQLDISGVQTGRVWFGMNQYSTFAISKLWLE